MLILYICMWLREAATVGLSEQSPTSSEPDRPSVWFLCMPHRLHKTITLMSKRVETKKQHVLSISESDCVGIRSVNAIRFCMWVQLNETE